MERWKTGLLSDFLLDFLTGQCQIWGEPPSKVATGNLVRRVPGISDTLAWITLGRAEISTAVSQDVIEWE